MPFKSAGDGAESAGKHEADPGVDAEIELKDRRRIGAGAEEGSVPEGALAGIAAQQIPGLAQQREIKGHDDKMRQKIGCERERQQDERHQHANDCRAWCFHALTRAGRKGRSGGREGWR